MLLVSMGDFWTCSVAKLMPSKNGWAFKSSRVNPFPYESAEAVDEGADPNLLVGSITKSFCIRSFAWTGTLSGMV